MLTTKSTANIKAVLEYKKHKIKKLWNSSYLMMEVLIIVHFYFLIIKKLFTVKLQSDR